MVSGYDAICLCGHEDSGTLVATRLVLRRYILGDEVTQLSYNPKSFGRRPELELLQGRAPFPVDHSTDCPPQTARRAGWRHCIIDDE